MSSFPADVHPDRMAACFRTAGSSGLPERLGSEPRFATRLAHVLRAYYHLGDIDEADGEPVDHVMAGLERSELDSLALRAGIVLRANDFIKEIRGPVLAALSERLGAAGIEDARRNADLAFKRPAASDLEGLEAAVAQDGQACLAAWIAVLPDSLSHRVRLKWPNENAVPVTDDPVVLERGPAIMRRLGSVAGTTP